MRFVVFGVLCGIWVVFWWWTYVYHIKGCGIGVASDITSAMHSDGNAPLTFRWSDAEPIPGFGFVLWRDSVIASLGSEDVLYITGLAYRDEETPFSREELGLLRARKIAGLLQGLEWHRILVGSGTGEITSDIRHKRFAGFRLRTLRRSPYVYEMPDRALIALPNDTIDHPSPEIDSFLFLFAQRAHTFGRHIDIIDIGTVSDSLVSNQRMQHIILRLVGAGFPEERIALIDNIAQGDEEDDLFPADADIAQPIAVIMRK